MKNTTNNNIPITHNKTTACNRLNWLFEQCEEIGVRNSYVWQNDDAKVTLYLAADGSSPSCYELELRLHGNTSQYLEPYITVVWTLIGADMENAHACLRKIWSGVALERSMPAPGWSLNTTREGLVAHMLLKR
jgi:hypothetical protein